MDGCVDYKQLDDPARNIYSRNNQKNYFDNIRGTAAWFNASIAKDWSGDYWYRQVII